MRLLHCTLDPNSDFDIPPFYEFLDPWNSNFISRPVPINEPVTISLTEHYDSIPPFAILSHRWRREEVSFQDMATGDGFAAKTKKGFAKIEACCREALRYGIEYVWVDTCCIDKSNSAELSEAINSMYRWYSKALRCLAYLDDVPYDDRAPAVHETVRSSSWFTRGWTLQELIAPNIVTFYSKDWQQLGSRMDLANTISTASKIDVDILTHRRDLSSASVAERMSWASDRRTTRIEDQAYSLMGLFGVHMPTLYGEGHRAFRRLQLEIMQSSNDQSLFAWQSHRTSGDMLATSPTQFRYSGSYKPMPYRDFVDRFSIRSPKPDYAMTNAGVHIQLPMIPLPENDGCYIAFLACTCGPQTLVVIFLERTGGTKFNGVHRIPFESRTTDCIVDLRYPIFDHCNAKTIWVLRNSAFDTWVDSTIPRSERDKLYHPENVSTIGLLFESQFRSTSQSQVASRAASPTHSSRSQRLEASFTSSSGYSSWTDHFSLPR